LLAPLATFDVPCAELGVCDLYGAAVVGCDHELNRFVFGEGDESCVVNHEEVVAAVLEWFAVEVAVDVVFCL